MELSAWKYYNLKTTERKENYFQEFFIRFGLLLQYSVGLRTNYPITSIRAELLLHQYNKIETGVSISELPSFVPNE